MPIYEYECEKCGLTFEAMQSISAKPLTKCESEKCKGKVRRLVSASGFILKGGGWYATDYPSENRKEGWEKDSNDAKPATVASGESTSAESSGTETPAPKPAAKESKPKPKAKKPAAKNPYSGAKTKKVKTSK
jgi:putative FmdB family regulatory protein